MQVSGKTLIHLCVRVLLEPQGEKVLTLKLKLENGDTLAYHTQGVLIGKVVFYWLHVDKEGHVMCGVLETHVWAHVNEWQLHHDCVRFKQSCEKLDRELLERGERT